MVETGFQHSAMVRQKAPEVLSLPPFLSHPSFSFTSPLRVPKKKKKEKKETNKGRERILNDHRQLQKLLRRV